MRSASPAQAPLLISSASASVARHRKEEMNPSTLALLQANSNFLSSHNQHSRVSPYDIDDKLFSEFQNENCSKTTINSPRDKYLEFSPPASSKKNLNRQIDCNAISIENYDPKIRTGFTEEFTLMAIKRLGIRQSDLFFPTPDDIEKYEGNKNYFKKILKEKAYRYAKEVKAERERLIKYESAVNGVYYGNRISANNSMDIPSLNNEISTPNIYNNRRSKSENKRKAVTSIHRNFNYKNVKTRYPTQKLPSRNQINGNVSTSYNFGNSSSLDYSESNSNGGSVNNDRSYQNELEPRNFDGSENERYSNNYILSNKGRNHQTFISKIEELENVERRKEPASRTAILTYHSKIKRPRLINQI